MNKHPWAGQKWGSRAGQYLCAVVTIVLVLASVEPLHAAPHPVRPANDRLRRGAPPRLVRDESPRRASRSAKAEPRHAAPKEAPKSSRGRAKASAKAVPPPAHTRGRRSRRQPEPENDPPMIHRASLRGRRVVVPEPTRRRMVVREEPPVRTRVPVRSFAKAPMVEQELLPSGEPLPQASENVMADVREIPMAPATRTRGKQPTLPTDLAGRQAVIDDAMQPVVLPSLYTSRGRLIVPPALKGSRDILVHQNTMADTEGLDRIQDDDALEHMQELHLLVPLRDTAGLMVNEGLPENRRYARPWAARFAMDLGRAYYARFHEPVHLSSAVRTVEYQLRLQRINGNAAAVDGDGASPHLTGQALDFGKHGMSMAEIAWMRAYLGILMRAGKIDVEEEFQQACFHISVYKSYLPAAKAKTSVEVAAKQPLAPQP